MNDEKPFPATDGGEHVFENGVRCSTFSFAIREGRGFEERSGIRGNRRAVQLNQVAAIAALDRPLEERSSIER